MKAQARKREIARIFAAEAPSTVREVLARDSADRNNFFGEGVEYHISEWPSEDWGDDIKLDDQGDPYYDIG